MKRIFLFLLYALFLSLPFASGALAQEDSDDNWELCPEPKEALANVPGSAEQLQSDIDRYTLCLNRAELLIQLEELKNKGSETGLNAAAVPLPDKIQPMPLTAEQTSQLIGEEKPDDAPKKKSKKDEAPAPVVQPMTIKDIRGINGKLVARITNADGDIESVGEGDTLADGSEVTSITMSQVSIRKKGKVERLDWGN